jgi:hypothetical protein
VVITKRAYPVVKGSSSTAGLTPPGFVTCPEKFLTNGKSHQKKPDGSIGYKEFNRYLGLPAGLFRMYYLDCG